MSVFVISDLHLSINADTNKSMEVFGQKWQNYMSRLQKNWNCVVGIDDTVIVPGDISWALTLDEALADMMFINSLNGRKIISKGNHDFWWSTQSKIRGFFAEHGISSIELLHNNSYITEDFIICGTRGWYNESSRQTVPNSPDYMKIVNREAMRLRLSLDSAGKNNKERQAKKHDLSYEKQKYEPTSADFPIVVFFHFPPAWNGFVCREIVDVLHEYNIKKCYFGHIHGNYNLERVFAFEDVTFELISSDFLDFTPVPVRF